MRVLATTLMIAGTLSAVAAIGPLLGGWLGLVPYALIAAGLLLIIGSLLAAIGHRSPGSLSAGSN
jgi:hypothetical protein